MSDTKHYVDENGVYLGGFGDGAEPPEGSRKVHAPKHGKDIWDGNKWMYYVHIPQPAPDINAALRVLARSLIGTDLDDFNEAMDKMK